MTASAITTRRLPTRCPTCRRRAADLADALQLAGELDILWLIPDPDNPARVTTAHYCRSCVPYGLVTDIACTTCGDGPLLTSTLAQPKIEQPVIGWLHAHGWSHTDVTWTCGTCTRASISGRARAGLGR